MQHLYIAGVFMNTKGTFRILDDDSPYEPTLLHAWHAIQSQEGRRQLRHCASTCLFATYKCSRSSTVGARCTGRTAGRPILK
ncbi:hypothetical protein PUN28_019453 [Cardiocondyla obscurior]|uniref:Uncharacterized protein n=1 Tax=Cardiocondyla obscurior TaxID=286306 RepID=A0AAW2ECF2_9HYME